MSGRQERVWRCDCGDDHFLSVARYPDDPEGYLNLADGSHCPSFRCRLKTAWNVILHGRGYSHWGVEIVLNPEKARELMDEFRAQWPEQASISDLGTTLKPEG